MKKFFFLLFLMGLSPILTFAQDNGEMSSDTLKESAAESAAESSDMDFSSQKFISDLSQLPAQQYYQKDWCEEHIRLHAWPLPSDTICLILHNSDFVFPVKNGKVISEYGLRSGRMHTGTDIKQNLNAPVVACFDGVVRMARSYSGYGKVVVVRHPNGLESVYSHLNQLKVKPKQVVKAGQVIGLAGRTGRATTEHLHFELRFLYEHFNSRKVIDYSTEKLLSDTIRLYAKDLHRKGSTTTVASSSASNASTSSKPASTKPAVHTVRKGDTLSKISRTYGVPIKTLLKLNHIKETSILSIGQKIRLK